MNIDGVGRVPGQSPDSLPEVSDFGRITSEQAKLVVELEQGSDRSPQEIKDEFLAKEEQKLALLPHLSDEQKTERIDLANKFIDRKIDQVSGDAIPVESPESVEEDTNIEPNNISQQPFEPPGKPVEGPPKRRRIGQQLRSLHRAEAANHSGLASFGRISAEQWSLVSQYRAGEISYEDAKAKFLESEEAKLNLLVESGKISEEEKVRRLESFSGVVDNVLGH